MKHVKQHLILMISMFVLPQLHAFECANYSCKTITISNLLGAKKFISLYLEKPKEGAKIKLCEADEKSLQCTSDDIGLPNVWTLPPFLPGRASVKSINFDLKKGKLNASIGATYLKGNNVCSSSEFEIKTDSQKLNFSGSSYCNWLLFGNNLFAYSFDILGISIDRKSLYANYKLTLAGTAVGSSSGFAILQVDNFEDSNPDIALLNSSSEESTLASAVPSQLTGQSIEKELIQDAPKIKEVVASSISKPHTNKLGTEESAPSQSAVLIETKAEEKSGEKLNTSIVDLDLSKKYSNDEIKKPRDQVGSFNPNTSTKENEIKESSNKNEVSNKLTTASLNVEVKNRTSSNTKTAQSPSKFEPMPRIKLTALIIGNGSYKSGFLKNPRNDAEEISKKLAKFNFDVTTVYDTSRERLIQTLDTYSHKSRDSDVSVLFYAGHGVQVNGMNYLIPVEMDLGSLSQITLRGIPLNNVIEEFMPSKTKLIFLDACRDNPLLMSKTRNLTRGLAPINVPSGTLIAFSTKDGSVAQDGEDKNSPFTSALLKHLDAAEDISVVLRKVRTEVKKLTNGNQEPWDYGSLEGGSLILSKIGLNN